MKRNTRRIDVVVKIAESIQAGSLESALRKGTAMSKQLTLLEREKVAQPRLLWPGQSWSLEQIVGHSIEEVADVARRQLFAYDDLPGSLTVRIGRPRNSSCVQLDRQPAQSETRGKLPRGRTSRAAPFRTCRFAS